MFGNKKIAYLFIVGLGIILIGYVLYSSTLDAYFVGEDYEWWTRVSGLNFIESFRLFIPPKIGGIVLPSYYRPLVGWTVWLDSVIFKMEPFAFHATSLFFHLMNTFLVGLLGYLLFRRNIIVAGLASVFFVTFPFHSEAVVWSVGGRYDVMLATFYLVGLIAAIQLIQTRKSWWWVLVSGGFYLALLSKEAAVTFPLSVLGISMIVDKRRVREDIKRYILLLFVLLCILLIYYIQRTISLSNINPLVVVGYQQGFFISRLFKFYILIFTLLVGFRFFFWRLIDLIRDRERSLWALFLLVGVSFLPTVYLPTQERQLYLPSVFFVLFSAGLWVSIFSLLKRWSRLWFKVSVAMFVLIVLVNAIGLFRRNERWRSAGGVAYAIADDLTRELKEVAKEEKVYLLNIPDSIDGAYVYRTHLKEAVEFMSGRDVPELVITPTTLGREATVKVVSPNVAELISKGGFMLFNPTYGLQGYRVIETSEFKATEISSTKLRVDFRDDEFDLNEELVWVFDGERMVRLSAR